MTEEPQKPAAPAASDYRVDDQELLLGFYKRLLWDWLVPRIPARFTPNALTIVGQLLAALGAVACGIASTGYPWLYVVGAVLFLIYLTADNVDGPHARRTGQTSPLGELLDHGLDGAASTALLVAMCFMLRLDGVLMVSLCAIGGLGFSIVFWEQFHTGVLIIPKVSSTEGVTLLAISLVIVAVFDDPAWVHFSWEAPHFGTLLVLALIIGYCAACVPPVIRVWRSGKPPWELGSVAAVLAAEVGLVALGADAIAPSIAAGLVAGDLTCRIIVLRHRGQRTPILSPILWLTLPLTLMAATGVWTPDGWAALSLAVVLSSYGVGLVRGGRELLARAGG